MPKDQKSKCNLFDVQGDKVLQAILSMLGPCARLTKDACKTVQRVQRLFFLNEGQGLSNFLTLDLGFLKYPIFRVERTRRVFPTRAKLLEYENALVEAAALDDALEVSSACASTSNLHQWSNKLAPYSKNLDNAGLLAEIRLCHI